MKLLRAFHLSAVLALSALASPHPGHGEVKVLSGRLLAVEAERIQIDVFDREAFSHKRVWVILDAHTKIEAGKARRAAADLRPDQEVDCMAETEEGKDGAIDLRALRIRLKNAK